MNIDPVGKTISLTNVDSAEIEAAYREAVRQVWRVLWTSLVEEMSEGEAVAQFTRGINRARRARELALNFNPNEVSVNK